MGGSVRRRGFTSQPPGIRGESEKMLKYKEFFVESEMIRFIKEQHIEKYYIQTIPFGLIKKYLLEWEI